MIRISLPYIVEFVVALDRLGNILQDRPIGDVYGYAYSAKAQIDQLFGASLYSSNLRSSRQLSSTLSTALGSLLARPITDTVTLVDQWAIITNRDQFRTAFLAELGVMPSFFVTQKGGFDTSALLDDAATLFPPDMVRKAPETIPDVGSVGRAIAFDLGTAAGFHIFRVLEAVLRRYYSSTTGDKPAAKVRNIGAYVQVLRKAGCGDERILATLDQIRQLHRNPLVHPELTVTTDQAVSLLGIARSAIEAMLAVLPEVSDTYPQGSLANLFATFAPEPIGDYLPVLDPRDDDDRGA